ncbi:hypothetical protein [Pararhodonellum marinum]|uniref:hypothetical protein n=1 Tax=Pararhodonellum marinum TaxID=2755358 RepID=UPI0018902AAE|nr:hypothetical protein [Pararhodonellum marinum]
MKKLLIIILSLQIIAPVWAQRDGRPRFDREKFESARIAFISQRLNLKPDQAVEFWPLFNQHSERREASMKSLAEISRTNTENLSDEKAKELINKRFTIQQEMLENEKFFMNKITDVITPQQALKLVDINRDFAREVYRMQPRGGRERIQGSPSGQLVPQDTILLPTPERQFQSQFGNLAQLENNVIKTPNGSVIMSKPLSIEGQAHLKSDQLPDLLNYLNLQDYQNKSQQNTENKDFLRHLEFVDPVPNNFIPKPGN